MAFFRERFFIDHQNMRRFGQIIDAPGGIDTERLRRETDIIKINMSEAAKLGMTGYVIFSRGFEELVHYDFQIPGFSSRIFPDNHPHRTGSEVAGKYLTEAAEHGRSLGLEVVFHCNQFFFPDEVYTALGDRMHGTAKVCPGKDIVWCLLRGKITEFFRLFPAITGLQLTTSETQVSPLACQCSDCSGMDTGERYARMVHEAWEVCRELGKSLQIRTWGAMSDASKPDEYARMTSLVPEEVTVSTKITMGDFHLSDPPSNLIGKGHREQVIEFDCWGEYFGWNQFPCYMGDQFSERFKICADQGIKQVAARLNWDPPVNHIFDHPYGNILNVFMFAKLCEDPYRSADDILGEWLSERVAEKAIEAASELYKLSYKAQYTWYNFRNRHTNDHSRVYMKFGRPTYRGRLDVQVGGIVSEDYAFETDSITAHRKEIDARYLDLQRALPALKGSIPDKDFKHLAHQLVNQRYCAQGIADCMQMYGSFLAKDRGERIPDLSDFETDMKRRLSEWWEHDAENCTLMNGPNVVEMLDELRS